MRNARVHQSHQRVQYAFELVKTLPYEAEILSHYARYLCVLSSGFLENSIRTILAEYAQGTASTTAQYVALQLKWFRTPNMENISKLLRGFDSAWTETFLSEVQGEPSDSVNSIVHNRHQIAHGEDVGISYATIRSYFDEAVMVIELIDDKFHV